MEKHQSANRRGLLGPRVFARFGESKIALLGALVLLCFIELGFMTLWRGFLGNSKSALAYFLVQILISILPFALLFQPEMASRHFKSLSRGKGVVLLSIGLVAGWVLLRQLYLSVPDFGKLSDVIPQVQHLSTRFLHFEYPYQPIQFETYVMQPTYLPTHWMPYCAAVLTNIDPRWVSFFVFALAWAAILVVLLKVNTIRWVSTLSLVFPLLVLVAVKYYDPKTWYLSVEMLITGYYLLFGLSLIDQNLMLQRLGLVLCLLSRFSLVFWLPVYALVFYHKHGAKKTVRHFGIVAIACTALYAPFFINDPLIFSKAQAYYNQATIGEWNQGGTPSHLYNGLGFAKLYFERHRTDLLQGILVLRTTLFVLMPLLTLFSIGVYYKIRKKMDDGLFLICSLKLSLAFFYSFVQIPYSYLFLVPMIISIPLLIKTSMLVYNNGS